MKNSNSVEGLADSVFVAIRTYTSHQLDKRTLALQQQNDAMAKIIEGLALRLGAVEQKLSEQKTQLRSVG